jgi:hypothetical protein
MEGREDEATTRKGADGGVRRQGDEARTVCRRRGVEPQSTLGRGSVLGLPFPLTRLDCHRGRKRRKKREMGLGPARGRNKVSLSQARVKARELHSAVREGRDPLAEREAAKVKLTPMRRRRRPAQ